MTEYLTTDSSILKYKLNGLHILDNNLVILAKTGWEAQDRAKELCKSYSRVFMENEQFHWDTFWNTGYYYEVW
jgi:hypothetical protein